MRADATAPWRVTFRPATAPQRADPRRSVDQAIELVLRAAGEGLVRDRRGRPLSSSAVAELRWLLRGYVSEALGDAELTRVRARHVQQLLQDLEAAGLSRDRVRAVAGAMRTLYDHAIERGLARYNPAERLPAPAAEANPRPGRADRWMAVALDVSTAGFALVAVVLLAHNL